MSTYKDQTHSSKFGRCRAKLNEVAGQKMSRRTWMVVICVTLLTDGLLGGLRMVEDGQFTWLPVISLALGGGFTLLLIVFWDRY